MKPTLMPAARSHWQAQGRSVSICRYREGGRFSVGLKLKGGAAAAAAAALCLGPDVISTLPPLQHASLMQCGEGATPPAHTHRPSPPSTHQEVLLDPVSAQPAQAGQQVHQPIPGSVLLEGFAASAQGNHGGARLDDSTGLTSTQLVTVPLWQASLLRFYVAGSWHCCRAAPPPSQQEWCVGGGSKQEPRRPLTCLSCVRTMSSLHPALLLRTSAVRQTAKGTAALTLHRSAWTRSQHWDAVICRRVLPNPCHAPSGALRPCPGPSRDNRTWICTLQVGSIGWYTWPMLL